MKSIKNLSDFIKILENIQKNRQRGNEKKWLFSLNTKYKIIINKNDKGKILKELELINITNKSLFPEIENNIKILKKIYR